MAEPPALLQAGAHECRADTVVLELGPYRQGRQRQRRHAAVGGADEDGTEENVPHCVSVRDGHQREGWVEAWLGAQGVDQPCFIVAAEWQGMDGAVVSRIVHCSGTDAHRMLGNGLCAKNFRMAA